MLRVASSNFLCLFLREGVGAAAARHELPVLVVDVRLAAGKAAAAAHHAPLDRQVALERARDFGVSHADFRFERNRYQFFSVRDGSLEGAQDTEDLGFAVRVILDGAWGFASGVALTESEAVTIAETASTSTAESSSLVTEARRRSRFPDSLSGCTGSPSDPRV